MTHYRMLDRSPSVVITSNRNELKVYNGNIVYLNNGDNFELRFFNPLQEKIGVEIMFNGIRKGDGYLVLNPGQDLILDRFLDEQRKMLFETYNINGNDEAAVKAIEKNGLITFNFYKESNSYGCWNNDREININYDFPPKPRRYRDNGFLSKGIATAGSFTSSSRGLQGPNGPAGATGKKLSSRSSSLGSTTYSSGNAIYTSNTSSFNQWTTPGVYCNEVDSSTLGEMSFDSLETGRVEKGDYSDQNLKRVNAQFSSIAFHSISYQIYPYSAMDRNISEIREYCSSCGYRLRKSTWKFCPKCGSKVC